MTVRAEHCDPKVVREALRAYLSAMPRAERRQQLNRCRPGSIEAYALPTTDHGCILLSGWQLHAIAGDLGGQ